MWGYDFCVAGPVRGESPRFVLGSFRRLEDRTDGVSTALLRQCVCSAASPTQTRRTAHPVGPILRKSTRECTLQFGLWTLSPGHPRRIGIKTVRPE